jgi:hypothetical protein
MCRNYRDLLLKAGGLKVKNGATPSGYAVPPDRSPSLGAVESWVQTTPSSLDDYQRHGCDRQHTIPNKMAVK